MTNYRSTLNFYTEIRDEFLGGKSVRQIALERGMEGIDVLEFLRWLAREYDVERAIRTDQTLASLMKAADAIAQKIARVTVGDLPSAGIEVVKQLRGELNQILQTYKELSAANEAYIEHKRRLPKPGRKHTSRAAEEETDGTPQSAGGGGLEAMVFANPSPIRRVARNAGGKTGFEEESSEDE